jgi:hypothetical protein
MIGTSLGLARSLESVEYELRKIAHFMRGKRVRSMDCRERADPRQIRSRRFQVALLQRHHSERIS